jgi:transcriptional regulator with XRE-family HTH domain
MRNFTEVAEVIEELGPAVKAVRRSRGLSIREVGRQTGVAYNTIARVEAGHAVFSASIIKILRWLDEPGQTGDAADRAAEALADEEALTALTPEAGYSSDDF